MIAKPKREVTRVFIHCTDSDLLLEGAALVAEIVEWHVARGFKGIGYHYVIDKGGEWNIGRSLEEIPAAQQGHNTGSIAVAVHGSRDFPQVMLDSLKQFCGVVDELYEGRITFHGHCEVSSKRCPIIDYRALLQLDDKGRLGGAALVAGEVPAQPTG